MCVKSVKTRASTCLFGHNGEVDHGHSFKVQDGAVFHFDSKSRLVRGPFGGQVEYFVAVFNVQLKCAVYALEHSHLKTPGYFTKGKIEWVDHSKYVFGICDDFLGA